MKRRSPLFPLALDAVLTALSLAALYLSAVIPTGRWGTAAVAGLFPMAAVISLGVGDGLKVWGATGLVGALILPDKLNAVLYLLLFGLYPVVKSLLERRGPRSRWVCLLVKLCWFNAVAAVLVLVFRGLFLPVLPEALAERLYLVFLLGSAVFVGYDAGLSGLAALYARRVDRALDREGL